MKKRIAAALAVMLAITSLIYGRAAQTDDASLVFRDDGTFRILHLTDTQDDAYPAWDLQNLLREAAAQAKPDLIVLTGDLVEDRRIGDVGTDRMPGLEGVAVRRPNGEPDPEKTRENVEKAVDAVLSVLEETEIPYVIALGNNDRKVGLTGADWLEILTAYPHCVMFDESPDEADGVDYHVTVRGRDGADKFALWLMDTGLHGISDAQVDWYRGASAALAAKNGGTPVPAFAFQHIQCAEIGNLFTPCGVAETGARKAKRGFLRLDPAAGSGYNFYSYEPCAPGYEFTAWKDCGDVIGAFFGHQHVEGFSGVWNGIEMGFTYGCEFAKSGPYGFRVLTLHEDDPAAYENELYRYTGSVSLKNVRIVPETAFTGPAADAPHALLARLREMILTMVSIVVYPFR